VLVALVALALAAAAPPLSVPLTVEETAGVPRRQAPASASVPLPRGRIASPDAVWLAAPDGQAVTVQAEALERWSDGSVRWLLLDFLADVPAGSHRTYALRTGKPPKSPPGPRLAVRDARTAPRLDAGPIQLAVAAPGSGALGELVRGEDRRPIELAAVALEGGGHGGPPVRARVVTTSEGPVRGEVLIGGHYPDGLAFEVRVAAFAGQSFVRVRHTLTNLGDAHYARIRSLALAFPGTYARGALGVDAGSRAFVPLDGTHELRHADASPALLDGEPAGRRAEGWARAADGDTLLTVVAPSFWQEYPKAFRLGRERIALDLFAADGTPIAFGTGAAKTHELWIALERTDDATAPADLATALASPLVALPPPAWIVDSRALRDAIDPAMPGARDFLARLATAYARYRDRVRTERWDDGPPVPCKERTSEHPRVGLYGLLNWGDWQFPGYRDQGRGCDGWGNLEYDLPAVLALAWAATGSRTFYDGLVPAARHYRDVDVAHHWPGRPEWVGFNHPHKASHFALEAKETVDLGHTWTEGLVDFYRLTGETRALQAARGIADALVPFVGRAKNPRQFGWPMLALIAVHETTGERRYLEAARDYARGAMAAFEPTPAAGDWKMGILADGLAAVHAATDDRALRDWLVRYSDVLVAEPARFVDPRYALPLGYVAALTGDARQQARALAVVRTMKVGEWGKPLAATGRTGFRILAGLGRRASLRPEDPKPSSPPARGGGVTPGRAAPPRGSRPAPRRP
jgi:hypothetical protein